MIYYVILIVVVLLILVIYKVKDLNSNFNSILIRIHDGENEIDELLKRKTELLDNVFEKINNLNDNVIFSNIKTSTKNSLDTLKMERDLADAYSELKEYLLVNKSFVPDNDLQKELDELSEIELDLEATKAFYNDNSSVFNELIDKFPSSLIARKKGYDFKFLFTFKEEQLFEILKEDKKKKKKEA